MKLSTAKTIDEYIACYDGETKARLVELRKLFRKHLPKAVEDISYSMPAYREKPGKRAFAFFAGHDSAVSTYTLHFDTSPELLERAKPYITTKSTMRFENDKPLPVDLIEALLREKRDQLNFE